jgi:hypothetical protein
MIDAGNKASAKRKIIKLYEDNNMEDIPCEEEITLVEVKS